MIVLVAILVLAAVAALAVWLKKELADLRASSGQQLSAQLSERNADVDRRLANVVETMDRRLGDFDRRVDHRLESAARTATEIHHQLGKIGETNTQMLDRAKDLARLEQALRPPKARGGFGELLLGNLLADTFPRDKYELQYGFRSGERVDAVIRLDRSLVPIDAKFPLDNFSRLIDAENEAEREQHGKQFVRDVKAHVDAIADKYIRPDEGTYEFALMYLPAEAVYYELVCNRLGGETGPLGYAL
jgi:DNA recombination protein RmuC